MKEREQGMRKTEQLTLAVRRKKKVERDRDVNKK